jgi:hypothetical protein
MHRIQRFVPCRAVSGIAGASLSHFWSDLSGNRLAITPNRRTVLNDSSIRFSADNKLEQSRVSVCDVALDADTFASWDMHSIDVIESGEDIYFWADQFHIVPSSVKRQ